MRQHRRLGQERERVQRGQPRERHGGADAERLVPGLDPVEAGVAQLIYLVLFSYAFFFKGFTGLAVTIGSILTPFSILGSLSCALRLT